MRESTETRTMTTIFDLPTELLIEIVSKIPKHTRAVRLTCKNWNTLFKNHCFGKAARAQEGESHMVVLMDYNLHLMNPSAELKGKRTCLYDDSDEVKISQVFHCEGLLLCILKEDKFRLVVWNPYLGQTRWIQTRFTYEPRHRYMCGNTTYRYALGYENKCCGRNHKILRFINTTVPPRCTVSWYEIYNFESELWTTLDVTPHWRIDASNAGVSLKGNTYWCAKNRNSLPLFVNHIICFDFTRERFGPLMRFPFSTGRENDVILSCVREEKLAALLWHKSRVEVWTTINITANEVLWSRFLTVNADAKIPRSLGNWRFFVDEVKKVVMVFNKTLNRDDTVNIMKESGYVNQVCLGKPADKSCRLRVCSYVPSLVQIKQPAGEDRKQQSASEMRRYNEKMSSIVVLDAPVELYPRAGKRIRLY